MNNREIGQYFANTFEKVMKKHSSDSDYYVLDKIRVDFFNTLKKENKNLRIMIYNLSKNLKSDLLSDFVKDFYVEKFNGNIEDIYKKILKLKHLYLEDFKPSKSDGSLFLF